MRKHELVKENVELWEVLNEFVKLQTAIQKELHRLPKDNAAIVRGIRRVIGECKIFIPQRIAFKLGIKDS